MKAVSSPNHLYPGIYDSHCHLFHLRQKGLDIPAVLRQWRAGGLESLLNIVLEPEEADWLWQLKISEQCRQEPQLYPRVLMAVGIHPCDAEGSSLSGYAYSKEESQSGKRDFAGEVLEPGLEILAQRAARPEIAAIGETGLDYYHSHENKQLQQKSLEFHIRLAQQHNKLLVLHNRDSDQDLLSLLCLPENQLSAGAIMHCFNGNPMLIEPLLDKGYYFSFAGNLSYKNAENLRRAAALIPLERLLIETDAPFLAPQPVRGQINHPGFIGHTLEVLARCHRLSAEDMLRELRNNWQRLFSAQLRDSTASRPEFQSRAEVLLPTAPGAAG